MYEVFLLKSQALENTVRGEELETFVGVLKAGELVHRCQIPRRDFEGNYGYQRLPGTTRVNQLARDLKKRHVDLPTALLLSVRDTELYPKLDSSGRYILSLPNNGDKPFYVVDGQHRLEALRKLVHEEQDAYWLEYRLPVVIFFGADEFSEMIQFYTVNTNAKSIKTDLKMDLLKTRAVKEDKFWKRIEDTTEAWIVTTQTLTEKIAKRGVWSGRIRFSNQLKGNTLITSNSFGSSLKRVISQDNFDSYLPEQRTEIITAYWRGLAQVLPECFRDPNNYNIQKTVGVNVLHDLLPTVLTWATRFSNSVTEPKTYANILCNTLQQLNGDNSQGGVSVGAEFWKVGAQGASGTYSGGAGRRVLGQRIKRELLENMNEQLG